MWAIMRKLFPSMEASPDDRRNWLRRGAVFGTLQGLAGRTALVRATIACGAWPWEARQHGHHATAPQPSASHRLYHQGQGADPRLLRGGDWAAAGGDLERIRRAVWEGAHVLSLLLWPGGWRRAGVLPVRRS